MTLNEFREQATEQTVDVAGQTWGTYSLGENGARIVFLPGAQGTGEVFFKPALALSDRFRTITVTYPPIYEGAEFVSGLKGLLDAIGVERCVLVGSSLGGYFAQRFAAAYPERLVGLVVGNSFVDASSVQGDRYDPQKLLGTDAEALKATMLDRIAAGPESELRTVLLDVMGERQPAEVLKSRALGVAYAEPITEPAFDTARTLIIDSDPDPVLSKLMRDQVVEVYAGAEHLRIVGGTHYPYIAAWDRYGPVLSDFVTRTTA